MSDMLGYALFLGGLLFNLIGCIGLVRLPDYYSRLQASTKCITLGTCLTLAGALFLSGTVSGALKCALCAGLVLVTLPTSAHALIRAAHKFGIKLWEGSAVDHYDDDIRSGKIKP